MCRSIKTLRRKDENPTNQEIHDAALQFVRKVSGYRAPSRVNTAAFDAAVKEVSVSSRRLLSTLAEEAASGTAVAGSERKRSQGYV